MMAGQGPRIESENLKAKKANLSVIHYTSEIITSGLPECLNSSKAHQVLHKNP